MADKKKPAPKKAPKKTEQPPDLTKEDEKLLDEAWEEIDKEDKAKKKK